MSRLTIIPVDRAGTKLGVAVHPPSDIALTAFVQTIPGREWSRAYKVWIVPGSVETLLYIRDHKPADCALTVPDAIKASFRDNMERLVSGRAERDRGDSDIAHRYVTQPYAHQRAGLGFLAHLGSGALLWEMGLGKSKTAIDYAEHLAAIAGGPYSAGNLRVLVITPNTVARNWANEIVKHTGAGDFALLTGMSIAKRIEKLGKARYSIVNTEAMSIKAFVDAACRIEWDLVVVDESTRFKTHSAQRTKNLMRLRDHAKRRVILTGTPITGSPADAWAQLEFVQPGIFGRYYSFLDSFVEVDWFRKPVGVKPGMVAELARRIAGRSYRVLKSDVLDLPEKVYIDRVVQLTDEQEEAYRQMRDELRIEIANLPRVDAFNVLSRLLRLTQVTSGLVGTSNNGYLWLRDNAKVVELDNLLNDELRGEQVVIFGLYQRELQELARRYVGEDTLLPILYGPTPEKVRHALIEQFQRGGRRLLFAQIRTGGIGINLTAAQTAIYYSRSWSLEDYLQSQDRLHRIGQTGTVSIVHLVADQTVDEQIARALAGKQNLADKLTGDDIRALVKNVL
jgi:SNF2 family DNA or RNA helicase